MPRRCSGELSDEEVRKIQKDHADGKAESGRCAKCGASNVPARNTGGIWWLESHDPPPRIRPGKSAGYKR
jgi:hypothetical protein